MHVTGSVLDVVQGRRLEGRPASRHGQMPRSRVCLDAVIETDTVRDRQSRGWRVAVAVCVILAGSGVKPWQQEDAAGGSSLSLRVGHGSHRKRQCIMLLPPWFS